MSEFEKGVDAGLGIAIEILEQFRADCAEMETKLPDILPRSGEALVKAVSIMAGVETCERLIRALDERRASAE